MIGQGTAAWARKSVSMHYGLSSYAQHGPSDAEILERYGALVRRAAHTVAARTGADPDDLWSAGAVGLLDAVRRFDASRGVQLETFIAWRIRGAMLDELRRMDRLPRRMRGRISEVDKLRAKLQGALNRPPTRDELAAESGLTPEQIDRLDEAREQYVPLDAAPPVAADGSLEEFAVDRQRLDQLKGAMATLPERQQVVLSLRYVEELTLREIAEILKVSEPRVCQIHNAAVKKLRELLA